MGEGIEYGGDTGEGVIGMAQHGTAQHGLGISEADFFSPGGKRSPQREMDPCFWPPGLETASTTSCNRLCSTRKGNKVSGSRRRFVGNSGNAVCSHGRLASL